MRRVLSYIGFRFAFIDRWRKRRGRGDFVDSAKCFSDVLVILGRQSFAVTYARPAAMRSSFLPEWDFV